jgi:hypothetical protein
MFTLFFSFFEVQGVEPIALCMLDKHSTTVLHTQQDLIHWQVSWVGDLRQKSLIYII